MADYTFIKLYRKVAENELFLELPFDRWHAFEYLLLRAHRFPIVKVLKGQKIYLETGQLIEGVDSLAEKWGWSRGKVIRFLNLLEELEMIKKNGTPCGTVITIENYTKYQCDKPPSSTSDDIPDDTSDSTSDGTSDGTHIKKDKKDKKVKKDKNISLTVSKDTVCSTDMLRAMEAWNELKSHGIATISKLTDGTDRYKQLRKRINTYGIDGVLKAIENIENSSFLKGETGKGFTITFDWFIKPNNFVKVLDGNYNDRDTRPEAKMTFDDIWG